MIRTVPYVERSKPVTRDELHGRLISEGAFPARQSIGGSSMVWCSTLRCVSRLPVRAVVTRG